MADPSPIDQEQKGFTPDQTLELLIDGAKYAGYLHERSQIAVDITLRTDAANFYHGRGSENIFSDIIATTEHQLRFGMSHVVEQALADNENLILDNLQATISQGAFMEYLEHNKSTIPDERVTFYFEVLRRGVFPSKLNSDAAQPLHEAYSKLLGIKEIMDKIKPLEVALRRKDYRLAGEIIPRELLAESESSLLQSHEYSHDERGMDLVYNRVIGRMRLEVRNILAGDELACTLVEKSLTTSKFGKAHALVVLRDLSEERNRTA